MAKKKKIPEKFKIWIEARKKYRLSHAHIQMARELGMNPRKFGSLANHKQERWKLPLPEFIAECYRKRFGKSQPDRVVPIEQKVKEINRKKEERRQEKLKRRQENKEE
ncbi:MAG: hypothetical protein ACE5I1_13775 [bacterium]